MGIISVIGDRIKLPLYVVFQIKILLTKTFSKGIDGCVSSWEELDTGMLCG